jgi:hypothetical protein
MSFASVQPQETPEESDFRVKDIDLLDTPTENKELGIINTTLKKCLAEDDQFRHRLVVD